jgi:protein MAK11
MTVKLLLTIGTYEKCLQGTDYKIDDEKCELISKRSSFSISAHIGYVRAIAAGPHFLVSGSTDETIRIFDLRRRKDYGILACHSGSISCLAFYKQKMLFSGGDDGKIYVTRCADWETIMTLRGHSGGVSCIAVHPSGKLALSTGKDKTVKTWNLVTGKVAFKSKLPHLFENIVWSPTGAYYAFISERHVQIFATDGAKNVLDHVPERKILTGTFLSETRLAIAGEGQNISIYDIEQSNWTAVETEHRPRIKDIQVLEASGHVFVATGSSDGLTCLWIFHNGMLQLISSEKTSLRITCLSLAAQ